MKKRLYFDLLIIFLIGLIPILWLPGQTLLLGHDAGIPFDPITHFLDRFYVWSQRLGIGTDQSYGLLGAILIHGIEAFLAWVGFSMKQVQLIQFVFWFVMPGFAMYFLTKNIWPEKKYLPLIAACVYMINFYLLQAWFVAERTKFTIYIAVPLILYFAIFYLYGKIGWKKSIIGTGLTLGLFNGGGSFPLYGGLIILVGLLCVYWNFINLSVVSLKKTGLYLIGAGIAYVLLNAYWIFSYIYYIFGFYSRDLALAGGPEGALSWAKYLSSGSTFLNLFRGQGVPEWYLNPYHAYANYYFNNPLLIVVSLLFPILAYLSLVVVRDKKSKFFIYFFVILSLFTLIFASGPRSQLGVIYEVLTQYVPGFAIFRSAYYKFNYTFYLATAVLIGFTVDHFLSKAQVVFKQNKLSKVLPSLLLLLFIGAYLAYHFPFLDGSFLDYNREPGKMQTTRVTVPNYVYDFGKWANQQDITKRYLVTPELSRTGSLIGFVAYTWKYWSYAPINSLQTKISFVQNTFLVPPTERFLMTQMYEALLRRDMQSFKDFAEVFAIDGVVVQKDFDWKNKFWGTTDPQLYENILDNDPNFKLTKTFGKWKVYDITGRTKSLRVTASPKLNFLRGELSHIVSFPYFDPKTPLFLDNRKGDSSYFISEATDIYLAPDCVKCDLEPTKSGFQSYKPKLLPGSFLYPLVTRQENIVKKKSTHFEAYVSYLTTIANRRIIETKWMIDSGAKKNYLPDVTKIYLNTLLELGAFIEDEDWPIKGEIENNTAQSVSLYMLDHALIIEEIFDIEARHHNVFETSDIARRDDARNALTAAYDEVLRIHQIVQGKIWSTTDAIKKLYHLNIQRPGEYGLYVKTNTLSNPASISQNPISVSIEGGKIPLAPVSEITGWLYLDKIKVNDNTLRFTLNDSTVKNLLEDKQPTFPKDSSGISINQGTYTLSTDSENKCFYFKLENLDTVNSRYLISYNYRNLSERGDLAFFIARQGQVVPKIAPKTEFLKNSRRWRSNIEVSPREKYIVTPSGPSLYIYFCNGFSSLEETQRENEDGSFGQDMIQIKDISVAKISIPVVLLHQEKNNIDDAEYVEDISKKTAVDYSIKIKPTKTPVTLVMRESFGKYWQLCEKGGKCLSFDDKNHFESAGFTNGWYFKDGLKNNIELYYFPQRTYLTGAYITVITLSIIAAMVSLSVFRKIIKKRKFSLKRK